MKCNSAAKANTVSVETGMEKTSTILWTDTLTGQQDGSHVSGKGACACIRQSMIFQMMITDTFLMTFTGELLNRKCVHRNLLIPSENSDDVFFFSCKVYGSKTHIN